MLYFKNLKTRTMKKQLFIILAFTMFGWSANAQTCSSGGCSMADTNATGQYPNGTFSTTSSSWSTVSAYMNAGNYTIFNVTSGDIYEWTYCSDYGGSQGWDAELTLFNNSSGATLCYANNCGISGCPNSPYIRWTATFTGKVKLLTTVSGCITNTGSPYATLVWRDVSGQASTSILGIDISDYQTVTSWSQVKASGVVFAWAKSTEGMTVNDAAFVSNITNGESAGVKMGAYHFAHPENNSAADEAQHFLSVAGPYIATCELPPVLDFETTGNLSYSTLTTWVNNWMTAVKNATGITPIIYTDGSIASNLGSSVNVYPLWMADPDSSSTLPPTNLGVWTDWAFKQYSWTGTIPGISGISDVDLDVFNGNTSAFNTLIGCDNNIAEKKSEHNNILIYPNPANDIITIENVSLDNNQDEMISIYNLQGQLIIQQLLQEQKTEINISGFTNGMYFVRVNTDKGVEVKKFVKQ